MAEQTFSEHYGGLRGLRDIDFAVMARALGSGNRSRGEFLSFLLFERHFVQALTEMGKRDATRWLRRHPHFWCRGAEHDLAIGPLDRQQVIEQGVLEEFRTRRMLRGGG